MTTTNSTAEQIARAIAPDDWKLADAPQYAHLPQEARDSLTRKSLEAAERVLATGLLSEGAPSEEQLLAALNGYEAKELDQMGAPPRIPSRHIEDWTASTQAKMRAALTAAAGVAPSPPAVSQVSDEHGDAEESDAQPEDHAATVAQAHANPLAASPKRRKIGADSCHVALDPEKVAEWMDSPTHAPANTHSPADGSCTECPWPVRMLPVEEFIDALCEAHKEGKLK